MTIIDLSQEPCDVMLDMNQSYWIKGLILRAICKRKKMEVPDQQPQVNLDFTLDQGTQMETCSGDGTTIVTNRLTNPNRITWVQSNRTQHRRP